MMAGGSEAWQTIQDRASMGDGITESPCWTCPHFGTPPSICRDYPDCPLNHREPVGSMRNSPPNKRGRGKAHIKRDLKIVEFFNDGLSYAEIAPRFRMNTNTVAQIVHRAKLRGEFVRSAKPGPRGK